MNGPGSEGLVDLHAHLSPSTYLDRLRFYAQDDEALRTVAEWYLEGFQAKLPKACSQFMFGAIDDRIPGMDEAGIGVQVLSPGSALQYPQGASKREELVSAWNAAVHEQVAGVPSRFRVLSGLPLPDVDGSLREIEREVNRSAHVGFCVTSHVHGRGIDDPVWTPVFEQLNALHSVVFVHPSGFRVENLLERSLNVDLGTQFDDALTAVALYSGMTERYPNIRWIVAHLGGVFPFLLERLDEHWERDRAHSLLSRPPSQSLSRIYFESAGHGPRAIRYAVDAYGAKRMLFGTDFPMVMADEYGELVERSLGAMGDEATRRTIGQTNPRELLRLTAPAAA
jgi:aminocarboxymuconate-semialdehyde decarboxylase